MNTVETQSGSFGEYFKEYAPGAYLQTEFHRSRGTAFETGVPAFLGLIAPRAGVRGPIMLTLWFHFDQYFHEAAPNSKLAYAVRGFFENGGLACYVVPLADGTDESLESGLEAISTLNTIDLVCAPDLSVGSGRELAKFFGQQQKIVDHCERRGGRFAILDSRLGDDPDAVQSQWSEIDGYNGAVYYPWVKVPGFGGGVETVPPCGHVAGVFSRSDHARGVHKAPANEVLEEVVGLERTLDNAGQAKLNAHRINCLRTFPGRGILVWGARTLSGHDRWTYVNVRRLFLTATRWIDWHMQYAAFEPNNTALWARIERDLTAYFFGIYRVGGLKGRTPQEAFYVKCDQDTNTAEFRERSEVVAEIGLAPANPYEFIVVRLIRGETGVVLSETGQMAQAL